MWTCEYCGKKIKRKNVYFVWYGSMLAEGISCKECVDKANKKACKNPSKTHEAIMKIYGGLYDNGFNIFK